MSTSLNELHDTNRTSGLCVIASTENVTTSMNYPAHVAEFGNMNFTSFSKKQKPSVPRKLDRANLAKSGFVPALEHFWNGWASLRKDILLIICGSATSWIVDKVLNGRGGLHNRVTKPLPIAPFTLKECEDYAAWKNLAFDRRQIAECYMALGGVAYYWSLLLPEFSVAQNFDNLFFAQNAELKTEFRKLFASLFKHDAKYVEIVTALAGRTDGMTRDELLAAECVLAVPCLSVYPEHAEGKIQNRRVACFRFLLRSFRGGTGSLLAVPIRHFESPDGLRNRNRRTDGESKAGDYDAPTLHLTLFLIQMPKSRS